MNLTEYSVPMSYQTKRLFTSLRKNTIFAIRGYFKIASTSHFLPKVSRFINKYLYRLGLGSSINRYDNSLTLYSAFADKKLYSNYSLKEKFINFGSGAFFHNRWKNYDYPGNSSYYKSLQGKSNKDFNPINLCNEKLIIPETDNSVALIYCSHTLEHLDKESSIRFIKECYRILKKGGVLRVALPNTKNEFYLLRCVMNQSNAPEDIRKNYLQDAASVVIGDTRKLDLENILELMRKSSFDSNKFYNETISKHPEMSKFEGSNPERHINYWDFDNLTIVMREIGFEATIPTYQGSSVAQPFCNLHVFDNTESHISFYADIIK